jgi:hypothetical protein
MRGDNVKFYVKTDKTFQSSGKNFVQIRYRNKNLSQPYVLF